MDDDVIVTVRLVDGEIVFEEIRLDEEPVLCPWTREHGPSMWHPEPS